MTLKALRRFGSVITDQATGAPLVVFDMNLQEKYSREADVTAYPVEDGVPISDNHQARQRMFDLVGEISNTPLFLERTAQNRAQFYLAVIDMLVESGQRLTITAGLMVYENAVIKSYAVPRDYKTGQTLRVTLKIVQIVVVSSSSLQVPDNILNAALKASGKSKRKRNEGPQETDEKQDSIRNKSLLFGLIKG